MPDVRIAVVDPDVQAVFQSRVIPRLSKRLAKGIESCRCGDLRELTRLLRDGAIDMAVVASEDMAMLRREEALANLGGLGLMIAASGARQVFHDGVLVGFDLRPADAVAVASPVIAQRIDLEPVRKLFEGLLAETQENPNPPIEVGCPEEEKFCRDPRIYVKTSPDGKAQKVDPAKTLEIKLDDVDCSPVEFQLHLDIGECAELQDVRWEKRVTERPPGSEAVDREPVSDNFKKTPKGKYPHYARLRKRGSSYFVPFCSEQTTTISGIVYWRCLSNDGDTQELLFGPYTIKIV